MKNVALWGPSASGKTALLAQLYLRFAALNTDWEIYPEAAAQSFIRRERTKMIEQRMFPMGTGSEAGQEDAIGYRFVHPASTREFQLFTENRAGVWSEKIWAENSENSNLQRFVNADGLILLVDTSRPHYATEVEGTLETFHHIVREQGRKIDDRPVAVCVSKSDRFIQTADDLRRAQRDPQGFASRLLEPDLIKRISNFCPRSQLFPVSSVGVQLQYGVVQPGIFLDQRMQFRLANDAVPIHLFMPFEWLFEALEA